VIQGSVEWTHYGWSDSPAGGHGNSTGGIMSAFVKYSNWLVTVILLFTGARVLFVTFRWVLGPNNSWREKPWVPLGQAIVATLFVLAAMGILRWKPWGRSLGVAICAWTVFGTIFLTRISPNHRAMVLSFCAMLVLLVVWFHLPKIKAQFARAG
jgi:hypothetical protein